MFIYFEFYRSEEKSKQNWWIIAPKVHRPPTEEKQGNCLKLIMHRQNHSTLVPADDTCQGWFSMFIKFDGSKPQDWLAVTVKDYLNITILQCCGILIRNEPAFVFPVSFVAILIPNFQLSTFGSLVWLKVDITRNKLVLS